MKKKFAKYLVMLLVLLSTSYNNVNAQIDTLFWFAAPWVTPDHHWRDPLAIHMSTFNNPTTVRIQQPVLGYDTTINIGPNSLFTKYIDFMINTVECKPADVVLDYGFKITSDFPITIVYDEITRAPQYYNPETYSMKGQNGIGTEFVTPFQTRWNNQTLGGDLNGDGMVTQPYQQINIVATEDNTVVWITPQCDVVGHPANISYSVTLPLAGNTYTVQNVVQNTNVPGNNLAGSIVVADKPVSVTVSDDSVNPSGGGGCYDLMGDQIVPTDVIGNEYIVLNGFLNAGSEESIFVVATQNFTTVTINDGGITTVLLNQGDTYTYQITQPRTYVTSDKNVYLLHMNGYGCELGEALLPPLNCAGSDIVTFPRTNPQNFSLNILCPLGAEGAFLLNGNPALVQAANFNPVPGTGGAWLAAQITFSTAQIPSNSSNILTNSIDNFGMGIVNGGTTTGCLYHYMSSFLRKVITDAGNDTILCNGEPSLALNGSVSGGATTGIWTVLNGTGTLNNPTSLITSYVPSPSDYNQGELTFVLTSTGNCIPVTDTMKVTFVQSPAVNAGLDDSYCKNNIGAVPIQGSVSFAAGATWSGGNGGAFGNPGSLSTTYTPSPADISQDSVILYLTSSGSFFSCPDDEDTVIIFFTEAPSVTAGPDLVLCSSQNTINLNGSVSGATTSGDWTTTGTGAFSPSASNPITDYIISSGDIVAGSITLTLTSTNNGNCLAEQDSIQVTFLDPPVVQITSADSICSSASFFDLNGTISAGYTPTWTSSGFGTIVSPGSINTQYNISPVDTATGYVDIFLESNAGICPVLQDSLRVYFVDPPQVYAGPDQDFCDNELIQLNGIITGVDSTGTWSSMGTGTFNPGTSFLITTYAPSALDVTNGSVNLILTSASVFGCPPETDMVTMTFKPSPSANFNSSTACAGDNTTFTDLSTINPGSITTWNWDFGDQSNSIAQNPIHTYTGPGTFTVELIVGSSNGCYDTISQVVNVNPVPIANFTPFSGCEDTPINFSDLSFISNGTITSWSYDFGDTTMTVQNPVYTYANAGTQIVSLTVTSDQGCVDDTIIAFTVFPTPTADFSLSPELAIVNDNIYFTDESNGNPVLWNWDFGDNEGANSQNPVHNYNAGGEFVVTLIITDPNGCVDTVSKNLIIALPPALPTGFTPNGDGENDVFLIRGGPFKSVDFKVYNNWGELVFSTTDANEGWNGMYRSELSPVGVYTWTFVVELANDRVVKKSGDVTLMR